MDIWLQDRRTEQTTGVGWGWRTRLTKRVRGVWTADYRRDQAGGGGRGRKRLTKKVKEIWTADHRAWRGKGEGADRHVDGRPRRRQTDQEGERRRE